jgi:carbonic anhydrase
MLHPEKYLGLSSVRSWLSYAAAAPQRARSREPDADPVRLADLTARENAVLQLEHLRTFPCVREREDRGELKLIAWYFAIENADLWQFDEKAKEWQPVA